MRITILSFRVLLALAFVAISYLALTSRHVPVAEDINDKVSHILAFFVLSFLLDISWPQVGLPGKIVVLAGYGLGIEAVQHFLPHRTFSLFDFAADGVGIALYGAVRPLFKNLLAATSRHA